MKAQPLNIRCPRCGSGDVTYSCEPKCCFNHICADCLTSFQLLTHELGRKLSHPVDIEPPDSCAPTAACAVCRSLRLGVIEEAENNEARIVCADCSALLRLECAEADD